MDGIRPRPAVACSWVLALTLGLLPAGAVAAPVQITNPAKFVNTGSVPDSSGPQFYTTYLALNGVLYFPAEEGPTGDEELWKYDPATGVKSKLTNFPFNSTGTSVVFPPVGFNNQVFFYGHGSEGAEPWRYDPATNTASLLLDINPGAGDSSPSDFTALGGKLYFDASPTNVSSRLYVYDPSAGTTTQANTAGVPGTVRVGAAFGTRLYLTCALSLSGVVNGNNELCEYDPATNATTTISINPDSGAFVAGSSPSNFQVVNGKLYFSANDGTNGTELWALTQGSPSTLARVTDINVGSGNGNPGPSVVIGNTLYFRASNGSTNNGNELWKFDTTTNTATMVADVAPGTPGSSPSGLVVLGGKVYFATGPNAPHGTEVWVHDPVANTTVELADLQVGGDADPQFLTAAGGKLFFSATTTATGRELWVHDPGTFSTTIVANLNPGAASSLPAGLTALGSSLYFAADNGTDFSELYREDVSTPIAPTATVVGASPSPSVFGQSVTFTATVTSGSGTPGGTVTFKDGVTTLGTGTLNASGIATLTTSSLSVTSHSISAEYAGNASFGASSGSTTHVVNKANTQTALGSSANPSVSGQSVTFTATVTASAPGAGTPGGTVTFKDGATTLGTGTLNGSGVATFATSALSVTTHSITADYAGNGNFNTSSSSAVSQVVNKANSQTALGSSANPSVSGQLVTFTATVTASAPGTGVPGGTVTFKDGATTLATVTLNGSGVATLGTFALSVTTHSITADYGGDGNFNTSSSSAVSQVVNKANSQTALGSSANPSVFGQSVTFTATVTASAPGAGTPGGTVTFKDGATTLGTGTLNGSGVATFATSALSVTTHSITADYGGDGTFNTSSSSAVSQVVNKADTQTGLVSAPNPSASGQSVTLTATVTATAPGAGSPTGLVTFKDGATTLGTGALNGAGVASFSTSGLSVGPHSLTAVYAGDGNFLTSTSGTVNHTVSAASTTTALSTSGTPSVFGQSVTFTATVTSGSGTPTGTVTFKDGVATLGTGTLNGSGVATLTTSSLSVASHSITADYPGDASFGASVSAPVAQVVDPAATSTALGSSTNPSVFGQSVTFTATVTASAPGAGTPGGTVTFKDGAATLGTGTLNGSGVATFATSALSVTTHSITADYAGNGNFTTSSSSALSQVVNKANTQTALGSSANPSVSGQSVTFTATVTASAPGAGTPGGTVTFKDGATTLGTGTLNGSGVATFATSALSVTTHSITADYAGNGNFNSSSSSAVSQVVNKANSQTALGSSANPSVFGQSVTFTATVTASAPGAGTPGGTVTFKDGATTLGTGTLNGSGVATFATAGLSVTTHSITADYGGDGTFNTSSSSAVSQVVNKADTQTGLVSTPSPSAFGQSVTLTATVTATAPGAGTRTGLVTFKDGATTLGTGTLNGAGVATFATSGLSVGPHALTAVYAGDGNFLTSTSGTVNHTVTAASTTTALSTSGTPSVFGQSVTFTATVTSGSGTPTGTVTFKDGVTTLGTGTLNGSGVATFATSSLSVASHSITADYPGDASFGASVSAPVAQVVSKASTLTALASVTNPSVFGQSVTFTATVTASAPGAGTPGGTVTFKDGATTLGTGTLDGSGVATFATSGLSVTTHSITADYGGDGSFNTSSSSAVSQVVNQASTQTTLASATNPSVFGQSVTFTATVTASAPGTGTPGGTVTFKDGATTLGTGTLNGSGVATFATSGLSVTTHSITATYAGSTAYATSASGTVSQVVNPASTSTALGTSGSPSVFGQSVTFTATVTASAPGAGTPSGSVAFKDGAATIGTGTLNGSGVATFATSALGVSAHSITAAYAGDGSFATSTSGAVTQTVNKAATATGLSSSPNPSVSGQSVTLTATVTATAPGAGTASGVVTFKDGAATLGTGNLDGSGVATFSTSGLSVAVHSLTAEYAGDGNFDGSASSTVSHQVLQPTLSIGDVTAAEGNSGTTSFGFTVTLSASSPLTTTVSYATADQTATLADGDYTAVSGTLTFLPTETTKTVSVQVAGESRFEPTETFVVNLSAPTNSTILDGQGVGTITNDDSQPTISISDVTAAEGNSGTTSYGFTVSLSNPSYQPITVSYATADGTATTADSDYTAKSGTLTFAPGATSQGVSVLGNGDVKFETSETFLVNLAAPTNATLGDGQGQGTITNDDAQPTISISDVSAAEGNSGTTPYAFTISLSNPSYQSITVNYATADGTAAVADADYVSRSGSLTFAPASTSQALSVMGNGDTKFEPSETFAVNLTAPGNATIADGQGVATITNDDAQPTISISDLTLGEGNSGTTAFGFTVSLTNASYQVVTVGFGTADGTATVADSDYAAASGTLTFAAGSTSQVASVLVTGDAKFEPTETFTVNLASPVNASIADSQAVGTVTNDDAQPTIAVSDVAQAEGNSGSSNFGFTVTLSNPSYQAVTVSFATANGTATTADSDYVSRSGSLTFASGATSQPVAVTVNGDATYEPAETFFLNLSAPANATIGDAQGLGTITNDDAQPSLSIGDVLVLDEGATGTTPAAFTVTLSNPSFQAITVAYATADQTATVADSDYAATSGSLTFAAGSTAPQTITVPVNGDLKFEPQETFLVNLSAPVNATVADGQGVGTILNDDGQPTLTVADVEQLEGNSGTSLFHFLATLSNPSYQTITMNYGTADGAAPSAKVGPLSSLAVDPEGRFLYATVPGAPAVLAYTMDARSGELAAAAEQARGEQPKRTVLDGQGRFAYLIRSQGEFSIHAVGGPAGLLRQVPGPRLDPASSVVASRDGRVVYVASADAPQVSAYTVAAQTGLLEAVAGSPFALPWPASRLVLDPGGRSAYAVHEAQSRITALSVDRLTGGLEKVGRPVDASRGPVGLAIHPAGNFAWAVTRGGDLLAYRIDAASGALVPLSSPDVTAGAGAADLVLDPSGSFLYVANRGDDSVSAFRVDPDSGTLSKVPGSPFAAGRGPGAIAVHPGGAFLYVVDEDSRELSGFAIDRASGSLAPVPSSPTATTATAPATAGVDYQAASGTLTFAPGSTTATIPVSVFGDTTYEPDEVFSLSLSGATNSTLTRRRAQGTIDDDERARMISPVPGTTLGSSSVTFVWSAGSQATNYWLEVGTTPGGTDIYTATQSGLTATVSGLPADGSTVYVRLWTFVPAPVGYVYFDYTYTSATAVLAQMIAPTPGTTLPGSPVTFTWTAGLGITHYWLEIGSSLGGNDLYNQDQGTNLAVSVPNLPVDGRRLFVRLWSFVSGSTGWLSVSYQYDAQSLIATLTSPNPGQTLAPTTTFTWTPGTGALQYWLSLGTTQGGTNLYDADQGLALSRTVSGLPTTGAVWARIFTKLPGSGWAWKDVRYNP